MKIMKESYERSTLTITVFEENDVITTSDDSLDLSDFFGDNQSPFITNGGRNMTPNR